MFFNEDRDFRQAETDENETLLPTLLFLEVILRDVRLGTGYRVVEVRDISSKNAGYGQGRFAHVFPG